jgi:hypothetical protein
VQSGKLYGMAFASRCGAPRRLIGWAKVFMKARRLAST